MDARELQRDGRVRRHDPLAAVLPLLLELLGGGEEPDAALVRGVVEHLVRRREGRHAVEREVHLHVAAAVVDAAVRRQALVGQGTRLHQVDHGQVRRQGGDDDRRTDLLVVTKSDAGDPSVLSEDLGDRRVQPELAAGRGELVDDVLRQHADAAPDLRDELCLGRRHREAVGQ